MDTEIEERSHGRRRDAGGDGRLTEQDTRVYVGRRLPSAWERHMTDPSDSDPIDRTGDEPPDCDAPGGGIRRN